MIKFSNVSALQGFHVMRFTTLILIGILLVKSGYSTEEVGRYELFFFIANVVSFFWVMGLNNALLSYFPKLSEKKKPVLLFNLGLILLLCGLLAGGILIVCEPQIAGLLGEQDQHINHIGWIALYMIFSSGGNFTEYYCLLRNRSDHIVRYGFALFSLQILLILIGISSGFGIAGLLKLMVCWALFKFIWYWVLVVQWGEWIVDLKLIRTFVAFAFPLILHMLLGNGMEYVDGFLVKNFFDETAFAQFRYGARELPLVTLLVGAISTGLIPTAVNQMDEALTEVKRRISRLSLILFPVSIVLMLTSPFLFPLVYNSDYLVSAQIFNVYLLIISSRILMPQVVLFARHNNKILMLSAMVELVLNILLSLWFLQSFGLVGIAWATVLAFLVNKLILASYGWYKHGISMSEYLDTKLYFFWLSLLLLSYYLSTLYNFQS